MGNGIFGKPTLLGGSGSLAKNKGMPKNMEATVMENQKENGKLNGH